MRKCFLLLLLCVWLQHNGNGQVQLQSGSAEFSLPIFSYSDGKSGLSTNVSLSYYTGNGLKVSDVASNVGLGWMLNAGAAIERQQRGEPDDQFTTVADHITATDLLIKREVWDACERFYPNGFLHPYSGFSLLDVPKSLAIQPRFKPSQTKDYKQSRLGGADREQDVFSCNLNGRVVRFLIGNDANHTIKCLDQSKLKISYTEADLSSSNIQTRINAFSVTDENGIQYRFNVLELAETVGLRQTYSDNATDFNLTQFTHEQKGSYIVGKWYLSEMINTTTEESIRYEYLTRDINSVTGRQASYQKIAAENIESVSIIENRSFIKAKRISRIHFPDGHQLEFSYKGGSGNYYRIDVPGDNPLVGVSLKYNGVVLKSYAFGYDYFYKKGFLSSVGTYDEQYARLCLTQVSILAGNSSIPPYRFSYYTGAESSDPLDMVPSRLSLNVDHWGYYNKSSYINEAAPYNKQQLKNLLLHPTTYKGLSGNAAAFGILKSVQFPAGGSTTYEYEQNDLLKASNTNETTGGIRVKRVIAFDGENTANNQVTEYQYRLADGSSSSGWGSEPFVYTMTKQTHVRVDNDNYKEGGLFMRDQGSLSFLRTVSSIYDGIKGALIQAFVPFPLSMPVSFVSSFLTQFLTQLVYTWFDQWGEFTIDYAYSSALNLANPAPFAYSRVTAANVSAANSGMMVYEFTRPADLSTAIQPLAFPYSNKLRFEYWKYNLPKRTETRNSLNQLVRRVDNEYGFDQEVLTNGFTSVKVDANTFLTSRYDYQGYNYSQVDNSWISSEAYYQQTGRSILNNTTETDYNPTSGAIVSQNLIEYQYNSQNLQPSCIKTKDSKGRIKGQNIYYPVDYNNITPAITRMKASNIIAVPLTTVLWQQDHPGVARKLISARTTDYKVLPDGRVRPFKEYGSVFETTVLSPLTDGNDANNLTNYPFYDVAAEFVYDAFGDLIAVQDAHGRIKSSIYGYHKRRVIAQVIGAPVSEVAYTSFEGDDFLALDYDPQGHDEGNWSRMAYNFGKTQKDLSVTGDYRYDVSQNVSFLIPITKPYLLTLWATGTASQIWVNGSIAPSRTGPTYNGWTYYEFDLPSGTQKPVLSGSREVYVDEVRLYPVGVKMTTSTYHPTYGKTSECDANNRINYLEYDGFGRLIKVRDEQRNLIKTYEYHYKTTP